MSILHDHQALHDERPAKRRKKKHTGPKLPCTIWGLPNADKAFHEKWYPERDWLDIPHPFRMTLAAKPNGGKTNVMKHIIMRVAQGNAPFEKIIVVHCDAETTKEYDDLDVEMMSNIPAPQEFDPDYKTLVILEDLDYTNLSKAELGYLDRLFGYASTHKNISVMVTAQNPFSIPVNARRCSNIYALWNNHDMDMIKTLARKTGVNPLKFIAMMEKKCQGQFDHVWIDFTPNSPAQFRLNGYESFLLE